MTKKTKHTSAKKSVELTKTNKVSDSKISSKPILNEAIDSAFAPAPIDGGLIIAVVTGDAITLNHARAALEYDAAHGKSGCGIPMPKNCQVISLHAGLSRVAEQAQMLARLSHKKHDEANPTFKSVGTHQAFNWCSAEGCEVLQRHIRQQPRTIISLVQPLPSSGNAEFAQTIVRIDAAARASKAIVMMFVRVAERRDVQTLEGVAVERIDIEICEPGPGAKTAFSIKFAGADLLHPLGLGPKMCEIQLTNGRFKRVFTEFVAATLEDRLMCMARAKGKSLDEIAELLRIGHRSTVLRRLRALREARAEEVSEGWIKGAIEMLGLDLSQKVVLGAESDSVTEA